MPHAPFLQRARAADTIGARKRVTENRKVKQRQVLRESYGYSGVSVTESTGKRFCDFANSSDLNFVDIILCFLNILFESYEV